jgi:tRNA-splicing ligase RtcB
MTRSPDRFEQRARELCAEKGIDPDSRIVKIGSPRGMPAWCGFRDLAQKEVADQRAAAALAEIVYLRPQEERYKNAPLHVFGEHDDATLSQMRACMSVGKVVGGVLCADGHVGYSQPIGGCIAYENQISVSGNGFDIGCGHAAIKLDVKFGQIKHRIPQIIEDINRRVSFGLGTFGKRVENELFDDVDAWKNADAESLRSSAQKQVNTYGTSNHFLDLLYEVPVDQNEFNPDDCFVHVAIHSGSRGLGFQLATRDLKVAGGKNGMFVPPALLDADSPSGQRYIAAMELSGRYAYMNRDKGVESVADILGANIIERTVNHHNFSFWEEHNGRKLWVVRKGATAAFPGQRGFVGGSMGDDAVIIEGVDSEASRAAYYSTMHGAGRIMSRTQAKKTFTRAEMEAWLANKGVTLSGGGIDESPMSYRRLDDVVRAHGETVKVVYRLRPFIVIMASDESRRRDPYKD